MTNKTRNSKFSKVKKGHEENLKLGITKVAWSIQSLDIDSFLHI